MATLQDQADRAASLLKAISNQLKDQDSPTAHKWLGEIAKIENDAMKPSTVVGIVGASGAGKSALINALLDEERILPTSCMRACTAVVTEVSFNNSEIPYRAEIEFVSKAQWQAEIQILLGDLLDRSGSLSSQVYSDDSEASVAYAKIKAVYPNLTRDQIACATVEQLMSQEAMIHLGATNLIEETDANVFYKKLQVYIDSREKGDRGVKDLGFWPLIRVVKLFIKSRTLETGVTLVDLPGVHDSNAARAAVAQSYLKQCSGLFIVAPITRAVDDKSAKTLLGQSFKQQLKLDGTLGNITFICSKSDEIEVSEVQESLNLDTKLKPLQHTLEHLRESMSHSKAEQSNLENMMNVVNSDIHRADDNLEIWENLLNRVNNGFDVYAPTSAGIGLKRKRPESSTMSRKKATVEDFFEGNSSSDTEQQYQEDEMEETSLDLVSTSAILSKVEIEEMVTKLKDQKSVARQQYHELGQKVKASHQEFRQKNKEEKDVVCQIEKICILARNEYSRTAIKTDFADGVREIDQELEEEENPDTFDLKHQVRDYAVVAESLPVFCVSSQAYQKLSGRLKSERRSPGLTILRDTEIPQLQDHCRSVAEDLRNTFAEAFIGETSVLCNSIRIWASGYDQQQSLNADELTCMQEALATDISDFTKALLLAGTQGFSIISGAIAEHILSKFETAVASAKDQALSTVEKWAKPIDRDNRANGGLSWTTYRATVRRNGCFPKKQIVHDFNQELADPLLSRITPGWAQVFSRCVSEVFKTIPIECEAVVAEFHAKITITAIKYGIKLESLQLLGQQLKLHSTNIRLALNASKSEIRKRQKNINRQFIPAIAQDMSDIYAACATEQGNGSYKRIKNIMRVGVRDASEDMFQSCVDMIQRKLQQMMIDVETNFNAKAGEIISSIERDYMQLCANKSQQVLGQERLLKDAVMFFVNNHESTERGTEVNVAEVSNLSEAGQIKIKSEVITESPNHHELAIRAATPSVDQAQADQIPTPTHQFKIEAIDLDLIKIPYDS